MRRTARIAAGVGVAAAGAAVAVVAERAAFRRLRSGPDPEAGVPLEALPPDDLGPVRSFDGTELAVRAAGPVGAPVLVFCHGFSLDMTTWHYQWTAFSDRYRCVLFDQRAHGRSGKPPEDDYSVRAMGRDIRAVLDAVAGDAPAVLIGHSMGGMGILGFAERHPGEFGARVRGVVLADTTASDVLRQILGGVGTKIEEALRPLTRRFVQDPQRVQRIRGRISSVSDLSFALMRATNFGPAASPAQVEHLAAVAARTPAEVWVHTAADIRELDLRRALEHVTVPSLVVVGDRDLVTPRGAAESLRDALPDARAVVIARAGHVTMLERHEVFNQVLTRYLDEVLPPQRVGASGDGTP
ncbi:MAG TPA: alpha/beta hydrolase [Actinomycetota bacterium]|nr:alpha/beta hydrolase [Actinomycetota bacterium]